LIFFSHSFIFVFVFIFLIVDVGFLFIHATSDFKAIDFVEIFVFDDVLDEFVCIGKVTKLSMEVLRV
jgi:hypothetical protein